MEDIKISICIASYNQQEFLSDSIESCLTQTVKPHEILICNDGSTDHSLAIAKSYEIQGVKVIDQVNKGLPATRNTLLMNAIGDYILYLDSDDMLMETCIEKIIKVIRDYALRPMDIHRSKFMYEIGDIVEIEETKPVSKDKYFIVIVKSNKTLRKKIDSGKEVKGKKKNEKLKKKRSER